MRACYTLMVVALMVTATAASETFFKGIALAELLAESDAVVVAVRDTPPTRDDKIAIAPATPTPGADYPPYARRRMRLIVKEVLRAPASAARLAAGARVEVDEANFDSDLELHRRYYLEHVSKSPIYPRYAAEHPETKIESGNVVIVFLRARSDGGWQLAADGAIETAATRRQIDAALARTPR